MTIAKKRIILSTMLANAATVALVFCDPAMAQTAPAGALGSPAATPAESGDIIVLGTRRQDRTVTTSASPVDVISEKELASQPTSNLINSLSNIDPSFYVPQNSIADASSFVHAPSLRGLPADESLVMIDGKRFNRSALVQVYSGGDTGLSYGSQGSDIGSIPTIALANVEILRDGATAQYGSDAIAGVMNFEMRHARSGIEMDAQYGQYYDHGDGKSKEISATGGFALGEHGFLDVSGEYDDDGGTSRGVTRVTAYDLAHPTVGNTLATANPGYTSTSQIPNYPEPAQIWGSSPTYGYKLFVNSGYDVSPNSKIYFEANLAHSHTVESFNYRPSVGTKVTDPSGSSTFDIYGNQAGPSGANGAFSTMNCVAGDPKCALGSTYSFLQMYPGGFTPEFVGVTNEAWGTLGYKGHTDSGLRYDLSGELSRNTLGLSMYGSLSPSYGPDSQSSFQFGEMIQKETDANLDLSYPLNVGLVSPVTLSGGAEYRRETYTQTAGDAQSYGVGPYAAQGFSPGASGYGGTSPNAAGTWSQSDVAFYGDAETDLTKALSVGLAGRYEHYNTFGGALVGKLSAIYKVSDDLSFRGAVGTGFHAPSPGQEHDEILTTNFVSGQQVQTGTYPVNSAIAQYYGAKPLTPEKSTNAGIGFVAKPIRHMVLTVDAYSIKVRNRIFITGQYNVTAADVAAMPALDAVGAGGQITYFTNGLDTLTHGIEIVDTWHGELGDDRGNLDLTLSYTYNKSTVSRAAANVINSAQIIDIEHLAPNHRASFLTSWSKGNLSIDWRENYYGAWQDAVDYPLALGPDGNGIASQVFGGKFTTDIDVNYKIMKNYTLTAGVQNLFNTMPDRIMSTQYNTIYGLTGGTGDGQVYPRLGGPFGFNGGFWYLRLKAKI